MYKGSEITSIVENEVKFLAIFEGKELLFQTPVVFFLSFALPGKANGR